MFRLRLGGHEGCEWVSNIDAMVVGLAKRFFFEGIKKDMVEKAMTTIEDKYHAIASSVVDPATGKHPEVIVRRNGKESVVLTTNGSPEFAQLLERRMGVAVETLNEKSPEHLSRARV
jgi:hypothetical protein